MQWLLGAASSEHLTRLDQRAFLEHVVVSASGVLSTPFPGWLAGCPPQSLTAATAVGYMPLS